MVNITLDKVIRRLGRDYEDYYDPQPQRPSDMLPSDMRLLGKPVKCLTKVNP